MCRDPAWYCATFINLQIMWLHSLSEREDEGRRTGEPIRDNRRQWHVKLYCQPYYVSLALYLCMLKKPYSHKGGREVRLDGEIRTTWVRVLIVARRSCFSCQSYFLSHTPLNSSWPSVTKLASAGLQPFDFQPCSGSGRREPLYLHMLTKLIVAIVVTKITNLHGDSS